MKKFKWEKKIVSALLLGILLFPSAGAVESVWRSSLPDGSNYVRVGHPYEIPVYASDGVTVLDSFVIATANSVNIDAAE